MPTRLVKCLCIAVLFVAFVLWHWIRLRVPVGVAVCLGGAVVAVRPSIRSGIIGRCIFG